MVPIQSMDSPDLFVSADNSMPLDRNNCVSQHYLAKLKALKGIAGRMLLVDAQHYCVAKPHVSSGRLDN
jgi:hypothetical protein